MTFFCFVQMWKCREIRVEILACREKLCGNGEDQENMSKKLIFFLNIPRSRCLTFLDIPVCKNNNSPCQGLKLYAFT